MMERRKLGTTGLTVSEIAFGGVEIGIPYGIGVGGKEDMLPRKEAINLLNEAIDCGVNFFDTARIYGESESIMGEAFQNRRREVVIATKCCHFNIEDGDTPDYDQIKKIVESSLDESLATLKTDYIDVFMLHHVNINILKSREVEQVFADLKKSGKIRATGVSTYTLTETHLAIYEKWDVVQLPFNLMDQRHGEYFELAEQNGVGLVIRSVLMKGILSNKGLNLHPALQDVESHLKVYSKIFNDEINDISSLATKFAASFPQVSSVLVGIDRSEYLRQAIACLSGRKLDEAEMRAIEKMAYPDPEFLDLPKWDKLGWLK